MHNKGQPPVPSHWVMGRDLGLGWLLLLLLLIIILILLLFIIEVLGNKDLGFRVWVFAGRFGGGVGGGEQDVVQGDFRGLFKEL